MAQFTLAYTRGWAANSPHSRIRLKAELGRAHEEIALLWEEVRIAPVDGASPPQPKARRHCDLLAFRVCFVCVVKVTHPIFGTCIR